MVDLVEVEHLIDSMTDAVERLEKAIEGKNRDEETKLRTFIFDLYRQIDQQTRI